MAKYLVLRDCYGFQNRYWEKGGIVDIDPAENPPHHFKLVDDKETPAPKKEEEIADIGVNAKQKLTRKELIAEVKKRGVANAHTLTNEKLKSILFGD